MKKQFLLFLMFTALTGRAQFSKGMRMAGSSIGSIVYNRGSADIEVSQIGTNQSSTRQYDINLSPALGWFLSTDQVLGVSLMVNPEGINTSFQQNGSTYQRDKNNSFNVGVGGFFRHYFSSGKTLLPFAHAAVSGGISNLKTEGFFYGGSGPAAYKDSYEGSSNGGFFGNASLQLGVTKMVGAVTGIDFSIGYNYSHTGHTFTRTTFHDIGNDGTIEERRENETTTKFNNHGFQVAVGFQVFLPAGKK
ncbi:MAG TPA: hypothetical protein VEB63_02435 [Chitinophagaceae bacterium]|nr:hypothetical protein [Chitinophagaceae bacterium]